MSKLRAVTSSDVAKHAGVSQATVSAVISGSGRNMRVSEATRQHVLAIAAELNYTPHPAARALRRQRSDTIALIPAASPAPPSEKPISALLSFYLARAAMNRGYTLLETRADLSGKSDDLIHFLLNHHVDGVIFERPFSQDDVQEVVKNKLPVVQLVRPKPVDATSTISVEFSKGIHAAIDHLVGLGHHRVAFIGLLGSHPVDRARLDAFLEAMAHHALTVPDAYLQLKDDYSLAEGQAGMQALLELARRPTAVFIASDSLALGALRTLYEAHVRVPDDISLISFDDTLAPMLYPPLSSVEQPFEDIAEQAVSLIAKHLDDSPEEAFAPVHLTLPTRFNLRQSTKEPRADPDELASL